MKATAQKIASNNMALARSCHHFSSARIDSLQSSILWTPTSNPTLKQCPVDMTPTTPIIRLDRRHRSMRYIRSAQRTLHVQNAFRCGFIASAKSRRRHSFRRFRDQCRWLSYCRGFAGRSSRWLIYPERLHHDCKGYINIRKIDRGRKSKLCTLR